MVPDDTWYHKITKNSVQCKVCNDVIVSIYRHDFVTCSCGNVSVDGGLDYLKRNYKTGGSYHELSESRIFTVDELKSRVKYHEENRKLFGDVYTNNRLDEVNHFIDSWYPV